MTTVGVIGGGIQGAGVAIECAARGAQVDLYETRPECMTQASAQNEGKIHLGFVYSADPSLRTAKLMADAAQVFAPCLERWLETSADRIVLSDEFHYLVHRQSLLSPDTLGAIYDAITSYLVEIGSGGSAYFGLDQVRPTQRVSLDALPVDVGGDAVGAAFRTPEIAVDPGVVADLIRSRLMADPRIRIHTATTVESASDHGDRAELVYRRDGKVERKNFDHIVNTSWESLVAIDLTAGLQPIGPWLYRRKYFLRVPADRNVRDLMSATIVLGGFGDTVRYRNGDAFLSWYPVGRRAITPSSRLDDDDGHLTREEEHRLRSGIVEGLAAIFPGLPRQLVEWEDLPIQSGAIYALGATDVSDPASRLHERFDVGLRSLGRYHSIDTGKYTLGPLFAMQAADAIMSA